MPLEGQIVVDAGCHHGNYAVVFKVCKAIHCIVSIRQCVEICQRNLELNGMQFSGRVYLALMAGGYGALEITHARPDIYKMDIEGAEFRLFPGELEKHPQVHTWIVEIHPAQGNPDTIAAYFKQAGYDLLKVNREELKVDAYHMGQPWKTHATLIARKALHNES